MKEALKKHWKPITATVCCAVVLCAAAYYVNFVYIPEVRQARAEELDAAALAQQAKDKPADYNFSINTSLTPSNDAAPSDGDEPATGADANIGSGDLEDITGADGVYHGETPTATSAGKPAGTVPSGGAGTNKPNGNVTTPPTSGTAKPSGSNPGGSDAPGGGSSNAGNTSNPSNGTQGGDNSTPSGGGSGTETKPNPPSTPPSGGSSTDKPSGGSTTSGSSTPEATRTENGQKQVYVDGFGWIADTSGGESNYIEMGPDTGNYIGEMG